MEGRTRFARYVRVPIAVSLWCLGAPSVEAQVSGEPVSLDWSVPDVLPPGALIAVVRGDPTGPGRSTLQVSMPNGYRIPPHSHPAPEHVEVRAGTLLAGMGDRLDPRRTRALSAGDSATAPAGISAMPSYCASTSFFVTRRSSEATMTAAALFIADS